MGQSSRRPERGARRREARFTSGGPPPAKWVEAKDPLVAAPRPRPGTSARRARKCSAPVEARPRRPEGEHSATRRRFARSASPARRPRSSAPRGPAVRSTASTAAAAHRQPRRRHGRPARPTREEHQFARGGPAMPTPSGNREPAPALLVVEETPRGRRAPPPAPSAKEAPPAVGGPPPPAPSVSIAPARVSHGPHRAAPGRRGGRAHTPLGHPTPIQKPRPRTIASATFKVASRASPRRGGWG